MAAKKQRKTSEKRQFEYKRLSSSMMKTFLQCKRKFHKNYIEGIAEPANTSFSLGTPCHDALEAANLDLIENPRKFTEEEVEKYVQVFREKIADKYVDSMDLFETGEELVRNELKSLDPNVKVLKTEEVFDIITPEGVRIYGFIDKIEEVDKDTIKITDYKTSVTPMSYEEAKIDEQLSMYELAATILYPNYQNRLVALKYLRSGKELVTSRTATAQLNFRKQLLAVHNAILKYLEEVKDKKECAKGSVNPLCNWCAYKVDCNDYLTQIEKYSDRTLAIEEMTDEKFIDEYNKVQLVYKALEDYKSALKLWALKRIEQEPEVPICNNEKSVSTLSKTRKLYDPKYIAKNISYEDFVGLVSITNTKMNKYLDSLDDEDLKVKLEQSAEIKFNSPEIRFRKL